MNPHQYLLKLYTETVGPLLRPRPETEALCPTLDRLRLLAHKNMPNTIFVHPTQDGKRFAMNYSAKLNDLAYLMRVEADTQQRAIPALILSEDESGTEVHKEHLRRRQTNGTD